MEYNVVLSSLCNVDLEKIVSYYYELNTSTGTKYYKEIMELIKKLRVFPQVGRVVPECEDVFYDTYRELLYENYRIVYRLESDTIYIVRILDARMDIDFSSITLI